MAIITNQTELTAAIVAQDPLLQIANDVMIDQVNSINYPATLTSTGGRFRLLKGTAFFSYMIDVVVGANLTISNLILDGANQPIDNITNRSLVSVAGGEVTLTTDSILQNNNAYLEGGGIYLRGDATYSNVCTMNGNATIENCTSRVTGGGVMVALLNNDDLLTIADGVVIQNNTAQNGAGVYFRSYLAGVAQDLVIGDTVQIINNRTVATAAGPAQSGGGIFFTNFIGGNTLPMSLSITESATVSTNTGLNGGGIFFQGTTLGDQFVMDGGTIASNTATFFGGGISIEGSSAVTFTGGDISTNSALTGGAIYNTSPSTLTVTDGASIAGNGLNTASLDAPGIYNAGMFNVNGNRDITNGLYLVNINSVAQIIGPITPGSAIQLDNTSYVAPNPVGTPISVAMGTSGYLTLVQADADAFIKPPIGFEGWEVRLEGTTQVVIAPIEYPITYIGLMGATNPNLPSYNFTTLPVVLLDPGPVLGFEFIGWFNEAGNPIRFIPLSARGPLTIEARFVRVETNVVIFNPNDAEGPPATNIPDPIFYNPGENVTIPTTVPIREGFQFLGWNTEADGSGIMYQPGAVITNPAGTVNLFAQWQRIIPPIEYPITYTGLMGATNPNPTSYNFTTLPIVLQDPGPVPGFQFIGWFDEDGNRVEVIPEGTRGPLTIEARFVALETNVVIFNPNDAEGPPATNIPDPIFYNSGENVTIPTIVPIREGFQFLGWNTEADGSGIMYQPGDVITNPVGTVNLFAQWQRIIPPVPPRPPVRPYYVICCCCCSCRCKSYCCKPQLVRYGRFQRRSR